MKCQTGVHMWSAHYEFGLLYSYNYHYYNRSPVSQNTVSKQKRFDVVVTSLIIHTQTVHRALQQCTTRKMCNTTSSDMTVTDILGVSYLLMLYKMSSTFHFTRYSWEYELGTQPPKMVNTVTDNANQDVRNSTPIVVVCTRLYVHLMLMENLNSNVVAYTLQCFGWQASIKLYVHIAPTHNQMKAYRLKHRMCVRQYLNFFT